MEVGERLVHRQNDRHVLENTQRTYRKHTGHREKRIDEIVEVTKRFTDGLWRDRKKIEIYVP